MSQQLYLPDTDSQASYCDLSYFDYELHQATWKKIIDQHPFNHKLSLFLPHCSKKTVEAHLSEQQPFYYKTRLPLVKLLDSQFYSRHVKSTKDRLLLHTIGTRLDSDTVIVLDMTGHLILSMEKTTYETFGMVGKKQKEMDRKKSRYVIDIDLADAKMGPGNKTFDRLKWCFENTLTDEYDMVATSVDQVTGDTNEIEWPANIEATKQDIEMNLEEINHIDIPQWTPRLERNMATEKMDQQWEEDALQAMEWIGLVQTRANRLNSMSSGISAFLSTYQPPLPVAQNGLGTVITWTGLITPSFISNSLVNLRKLMVSKMVQDWASLTVWGYRDSPYTWGKRQHYYRLNGENDYSFLLFPPHSTNQQSFISMQMFGSQHIFS
ncbi:ribonuclease P 40kDa subunit-domain-containing protein [Absidia repens]|uniref:Ribonuclease P 40kDa subunit-domain-containing protein n=1 Tax=Absidia repens TaxID=90262 RepID=A0A1X2IT80_9FUNG|nr:ribonuclease P 40kDa subunit-domain-containing protein [Absidia repens]